MIPRLAIRTKLLAGLALVLAISAVLTTNTLIGLYSYRNSIKAFESKTEELSLGNELWERVAQIEASDELSGLCVSEAAESDFENRILRAEQALDAYRHCLDATLRRGRDPDLGQAELALVAEIEGLLEGLRGVNAHPHWASGGLDLAMGLASHHRFRKDIERLRSLVASLPVPTSRDMTMLAARARSSYRLNRWIAWSTGVLVVLMILLLARLSYDWIFRPIQELQRSVRRVGAGELAHRCRLETGDEMQELALAFNDMTARLEEICHDLERQVEERSRQLVRSEQLASVGFLAAGVAHEINNPLASISLGSETLERRLRRLLPGGTVEADEVWRCLAMIQSEAFRCKGITEKLLDFSRMRDHERQPSSLADLVADVIDVVQHMGRYREKHLILTCGSEVVAEVNPQELKQVVLNLVVNALDSMDPRGTLEIDVTREARQAVIAFTDNGCGMTPEVLGNIFEPFFTRSRTGKGTGLGLSITHRIVTEHRGQIEASSPGPGRGSRFVVRLPLWGAAVPNPARDGSAGRAQHQGDQNSAVMEDHACEQHAA